MIRRRPTWPWRRRLTALAATVACVLGGAVVISAPARADGGSTGVVSGRVLAPDGTTPQADAEVYAMEVTAAAYAGETSTDSTGGYTLSLPAGSYELFAEAPAGAPSDEVGQTISVTLAGGDNKSGTDIVLRSRAAAPYTDSAVSLTPAGSTGNGASSGGSISSTGQFVAFASAAHDLTDATTTSTDVYVRDMTAGTTTLISATPAGDGGDGVSDSAVTSDDGTVVAFRSDADDLVTGDTNGRSDVFVRDVSSGQTVRLSATLTGDSDNPLIAGAPTISADGDSVAFALTQDTQSTDNVDAIELCTRAKRLDPFTCTAVDPTGDQSLSLPVLSRDGKTLAYYLLDLTGFPELTHPDWHVEVRTVSGTLDAGPVQDWVSGAPTTAPSLTDDGSVVAYTAYDQAGNGAPELYTVATDTVTTPTLFANGPQTATNAVISGDGKYLAFTAENLYQFPQAWVEDLGQRQTRQAALGSDGFGAFDTIPAAIDSDGAVVVLDGPNDDVVDTGVDANGLADVFLAHQHTDQTPPSWGAGTAALRAGNTGATLTTLDWDAASDASGIGSYAIFQGADKIATVSGSTSTYLVTGLSPDTDYTFTVQAVDTFGNVTTDGPSTTVHTLAGTTGATAQLTATAAADASVQLTWDAATGSFTSYRIYRATGQDPATKVVDLPADSTTYRDTTTAADTTYTYHVVTVDPQGIEHPHTIDATVTTEGLSPTQVAVQVPKLGDGTAGLGGDVSVVLTGSPGRTATAAMSVLSWFDAAAPGTKLGAPASTTVTVALTEDAAKPGTYRGTLPIANGTTRILGVTGTVSDGAGHATSDTATGLPVDVSGGIDTTVTDPYHKLTAARLVAFSFSAGNGFDQPVTPATLTNEAAVETGTYDVRLVSGTDQYVAADNNDVEVEPGLYTDIALTAAFPASLTVSLGSTTSALAGTDIVLDGGYNRTSDGGGPVTFDGLQSGQSVTVSLKLPDAVRSSTPTPATITLDPGTNSVTLVPTPMPTADLSGTVTEKDDGSGVGGASVTVRQTLDGRTFTSTATTGTDGTYTVHALAGAADVLVGYDGETKTAHVADLPASKVDFPMTRKQAFTIELSLYTRYPGSQWVGPISVDARTAYHFQLTARDPNGSQAGSTGFGDDGADDVTVFGRPGDPIEVCASPEEQVGLPPGCTSGTLGTDPATPLPLTLRLGQDDTISATLDDGGGQPFAGPWIAQAVEHTTNGRAEPVTLEGVGSTLKLGVPDDGTYDVTVTSASDSHVLATATATTTAGSVDLGTLTLRGGTWFGTGSSASVPDNDLVSGATASVRVQLSNSSTDATDVSLHIPAPAHGSFDPTAVTVDGAVSATASVADDGSLTVPIGAVAAGAGAVVYLPVEVADDAKPATSLPVIPAVSFTAGGSSHTEYLTPTEVRVAGVTIQAPATTATQTVVASGRAPAGATVNVSQLGTVLTSTQASPGGFWKATVPLPDQGPYATYHLQAATTDGGANLASDVIAVQFRVDDPVVTNVSMYQIDPDRKDGRKFSFDPRLGAVRFPFVLVPSQPLILEATFSNPDQVTAVTAHLGDGSEAATQQSDGTWQAKFDASAGLGDIWFAYDTKVTEFDMSQHIPADELRANLPPELSDLQSGDIQESGGTVSTDMTLPSAGGVTFPVSASSSVGTATLTAADLDVIEQSGVPIMNLQSSVDANGDFVVSYDVPDAALGAAGSSATPSIRALAVRPLTVVANWLPVLKTLTGTELPVRHQLVKLSEDYYKAGDTEGTLKVGKNWASIGVGFSQAENMDSPFGSGGTNNYDGISQLYDELEQLSEYCDSADVINPLRAKIDAMMSKAQLLDNTDRALSVAGVLFAPETGLLSLTFDAAGAAVGAYSNVSLQMDQNTIEDEIGAAQDDPRCAEAKRIDDFNRWYDKNFGGNHHTGNLGTGLPTWDPSGIVYEAVESQPVSGVTATLLYSSSENGPWTVWDADWYGQLNPLTTDDAGHYGWDVPKGWWKVEFTKAGYAPAFSRVVQVLPPHFDVDAGMVSLAAPTVDTVTADGSGVEVSFDQYMDPRTVTAQQVTVTGPNGSAVAGTVTPIDPANDPGGRALATSFRFTPNTALPAGAALTVEISSLAQNYAGHLLAASVTKQVSVLGSSTGAGGSSSDQATVTGSSSTASAGGSVTLTGEHMTPGEKVDGDEHSDVYHLGSTVADSSGDFSMTVTLSPTLTGKHTIVVTGETSGRTASFPIDVKAAACTSPFPDVSTSSSFCSAIAWLKGQQITTGYSDGDFHGSRPVSRAAMAAYLYRSAHGGKSAPPCTSAPFPDVPVTAGFCGAIAWLKASGTTTGYTDGKFHGSRPVSRGAMAAYLYRSAHGGKSAPACTSAPFPDVPVTAAFCGAIAWLKGRQITTGYSDGDFHGSRAVSRQAMAAYLYRAAIGDEVVKRPGEKKPVKP